MTQKPQEGFDRSVEDARQWMRAVQERLQINDNTQGPRTALEARLRETEVCGGRLSRPRRISESFASLEPRPDSLGAWTARRSNQSILKEISPEYSLEGLMLKLKLQCFGHLM